MIDNQFEIAKALENPARFSDQVLQNYKRGANPMVQPNIAAGEEQRRAMIRNAVQGMMARQQAPAQMPTVVEIEKQKLAQQQAMQQQLINALTARNNTGVATLETAPGMFSRGGGVVAFSAGGSSANKAYRKSIQKRNEQAETARMDLGSLNEPLAEEAVSMGTSGLAYSPYAGKSLETEEPTSTKKDGAPASSAGKTNTNKTDTGKAEGVKNTGAASPPAVTPLASKEQGIGSLESIIKRSKEIHETLAKDTEGEKLLRESIKAEMKRSGDFKDLDEKQLDAIAQKRIDQMKKESDPLFTQMKENIQRRRGDQVGMTPEEQRQLFIANLGKRGRGWRNVFGESLEQDVKQSVENRKLNQARQDLLDKEEMELARAQMLESRGQRKEADEARKLAMQAHRESENLRRQQAQLMIGSAEKLATGERRKAEAAAKPELEELQARERFMTDSMREDRADKRETARQEREDKRETARQEREDRRARAAAERAAMSPLQRDFEFYVRQGFSREAALKKAEENSKAGTYTLGENRLEAAQATKILKEGSSNVNGQIALLRAQTELRKDPNNPQKQQAVIEAERQLYGGFTQKELTDIAMGRGRGTTPAASTGPWNNTYQ